ncbi:MAG: Tol-Pal system beta propeller repeat protein TolB [Desulfobacterales bacterium]|nr:Tol-Pal system beta propeller repeat protein TolB [Desulfobacterales bacterium]
MKTKTFLLLPAVWVITCLLLSLVAPARAGRIILDITSPDFRKMPMAIPSLVNKSHPDRATETGREMAALLVKGLEFHGFLKAIPASSYNDRQDARWQDLGVDYVLLGQYRMEGTRLVLELRLLNIIEGTMVFGKRYTGEMNRQDEMLLKFCDEVIKELTGEPGISRSRIAFVSDASGKKEIYVADVLGLKVRQITRHGTLAISPRFSPSGRYLAYTSYHHGNPDLYVTDLTQGSTTRAISRRRGLNLAPAWSPDGRTMVITLSKDGNPDLYLMDTRGHILRRLTVNAGINVSPTWSPDGRRIAFVSDRSGRPQIYIMDMVTFQVTRLTYQGEENAEPNWSPKGDYIAFSGYYEGNYHIFIIRPEGGPATRLTRYWGGHESPSWSPDGRQIAFTRRRNGKDEICAIFKNGAGLRPLFKLKGQQSYPQWSPR